MHIATTLMFSFATHTHFTTIPTHASTTHMNPTTTNMNPTTTNMHYTTTNIHHVSTNMHTAITNMHTAITNMLVVHWLKEIHFDLARRQAPRGQTALAWGTTQCRFIEIIRTKSTSRAFFDIFETLNLNNHYNCPLKGGGHKN
jgi:hypothetical protein